MQISLFSFKITSFAVDLQEITIMKSFNILLVFLSLNILASSTLLYSQEEKNASSNDSWQEFGENFDPSGALTAQSAYEIYSDLKAADTVSMNFSAKAQSVCQVKGCWMVVELADGKTARITFKDYGFFVPTDIEGKEVLVNGLAMVSEMDEQTRRHYAADAGKSKEEIESISGSEKTFSMVADGVQIRN